MNRRVRTRLIVVTVAILALVGVLIWRSSGTSGLSYYKTVAQVRAEASTLTGKSVRVGGFVVPGSIQHRADGLAFSVASTDSAEQIPVFYTGAVPGTFKDQADVVVDGVLGSDGKLTSKTMITKCPSKFTGQAQASGSR